MEKRGRPCKAIHEHRLRREIKKQKLCLPFKINRDTRTDQKERKKGDDNIQQPMNFSYRFFVLGNVDTPYSIFRILRSHYSEPCVCSCALLSRASIYENAQPERYCERCHTFFQYVRPRTTHRAG